MGIFIILRRLAAFGIDCILLAVYAGVLFLFAAPVLTPVFHSSPFSAEAMGFLLLTLPFALYFAVCESLFSATPGKHLLQLKVITTSGKRLPFDRSLLRSGTKFLPWELAHFSIWHVFVFGSSLQAVGIILLGASYALLFLYSAGLLMKSHRPLYDKIAGSKVVSGT